MKTVTVYATVQFMSLSYKTRVSYRKLAKLAAQSVVFQYINKLTSNMNIAPCEAELGPAPTSQCWFEFQSALILE